MRYSNWKKVQLCGNLGLMVFAREDSYRPSFLFDTIISLSATYCPDSFFDCTLLTRPKVPVLKRIQISIGHIFMGYSHISSPKQKKEKPKQKKEKGKIEEEKRKRKWKISSIPQERVRLLGSWSGDEEEGT